MKRVSTPSPQPVNIKEVEHEKLPKKPKRDFTERINRVAAALKESIEEHENSRAKTQSRIEEVCNVLIEAVNNLEKRLIDDLQQNYTKEEARLQESLHKLRTFDENEDMNDEEKDKTLMEIESTLCWTQRYKLSHLNFEDVSKWVNDTLLSEFKFDVSQSLSDEIKRRTPIITEVRETGPNEVHIDLEFLNEYEEAVLKRMKKWDGIEYKVEIWNDEEGEDYEVRSEQILGYSHKAYIEWRHIGGSECKVRGKAVWKGLLGEECESEWGEWEYFIVPREHMNSGALRACVVLDEWEEGETYTMTDETTNKLLYKGTKPYAIIPESAQGHEILIKGQKGDTEWESEVEIEEVPQEIENFLEDMKLFHTDMDLCSSAITEIEDIMRMYEVTEGYFVDLDGLDVFSNIARNYINDVDLCIDVFQMFMKLSYHKSVVKSANKLGYTKFVRDIIRKHNDDSDICRFGLDIIRNFACDNTVIKKLANELGYIELIRDAIRQHIDDSDLCFNGVDAINNIAHNDTHNQNLVRELRCIEPIRDAIREHIDSEEVCNVGLDAVNTIVSGNSDNQKSVLELGCIELIKDIIRQHIDDVYVCENGFDTINNIVSGNLPNQIKACEMGLIDFILEIIENHKDEQDIIENCYECLVRLFSSQETHDKWCTEDVIKKVEECQGIHKDSQLINKCLICLKRTEDPRVIDAVSRGVCTIETTACDKERCRRENINRFCLECATPQKCYQCFDCEGCKACCETCWKTKHAGHKGGEFFDLITYCE